LNLRHIFFSIMYTLKVLYVNYLHLLKKCNMKYMMIFLYLSITLA